MNRKQFIFIFFFVAGLYACSKDFIDNFKGFQSPSNFPATAYHFETNKVTQAGFELGRKLFYETKLSRNSTISCGSCHIQTSSFTHHGHDVSHGIDDQLGTRNTPAIMNLAWNTSFMWDGGVFDLDLQPVIPITNHVEMDETVANVLQKLRSDPVYPGLFKKAFGSDEISSADFVKALSQFMVMCVSSNSKYDSVMRNEGVAFTADEQAGYTLFQQKCSACHKEPLFTDFSFRNNGIGIGNIDDPGRYAITLNEEDRYKFKVPGLRNLTYTPPYMHDGRIYTLEAVLDQYSDHVQSTENLDPLLQQGSQPGIAMTTDEKQKILAFLATLNDRSFLLDKRFSEQ